MTERRPLTRSERRLAAQAERLLPSSVWLSPTTWKRIDDEGFRRGHLRGPFLRVLIEYALDLIEEQARVEATVGVLRPVRRGAERTARC